MVHFKGCIAKLVNQYVMVDEVEGTSSLSRSDDQLVANVAHHQLLNPHSTSVVS